MSRGFDRWEQDFRAAARLDRYAVFRDHLKRLGLPSKPKAMLEATISVVAAVLAYTSIDGRRSRPFLDMQTYDPSQSTKACYALTFNLGGQAYARVLADKELKTIDLADLFGHPWDDYEVAGYSQIWISRPDWSPLTKRESQQLEDAVTRDLLFDYSEDELNFWFAPGPDNRFLLVGDVVELDDDDRLELPG